MRPLICPKPIPPLRRMMRNATLWAQAAGVVAFCWIMLVYLYSIRHDALPEASMAFGEWVVYALWCGLRRACDIFSVLAIRALYRHVIRRRRTRKEELFSGIVTLDLLKRMPPVPPADDQVC